jgi:hypothetical protein
MVGRSTFRTLTFSQQSGIQSKKKSKINACFTVQAAMICHTGLLTACGQDQDGTAARKLSANLYDIYHCCVYSKKHLMMDRGSVRNM